MLINYLYKESQVLVIIWFQKCEEEYKNIEKTFLVKLSLVSRTFSSKILLNFLL